MKRSQDPPFQTTPPPTQSTPTSMTEPTEWKKLHISLHLDEHSGFTPADLAWWHTHTPVNSNTLALIQSISISVQQALYPTPSLVPGWFDHLAIWVEPPSKSGVAWTCQTTVTSNDDDGETHTSFRKEIHLCQSYFCGFQRKSVESCLTELRGVLWHEMVHVWQSNAMGTMDGGLIEGIADLVRLQAGLAPAHWSQGQGGQWNSGYSTTAYFLDWIQKRWDTLPSAILDPSLQGRGVYFVRRLNIAFCQRPWTTGFFQEDTGMNLRSLWALYQKELAGSAPAPPPIPTHPTSSSSSSRN